MDGPDREVNTFYQPPPTAGPNAAPVRSMELVFERE